MQLADTRFQGIRNDLPQLVWPGCTIDPDRSLQGYGWRGHPAVQEAPDGASIING
jgi:hypothetical protein